MLGFCKSGHKYSGIIDTCPTMYKQLHLQLVDGLLGVIHMDKVRLINLYSN